MKTTTVYILSILLLLPACAGRVTRPDSAQEELIYAGNKLEKNRNLFIEINRTTYPGNGYFYILSSNGIILNHPEKSLEGANFSSYDFISRIIEEKNGCISYVTQGRNINIFYRELKGGDILCFTFESSSAGKTYTGCDRGSGQVENE